MEFATLDRADWFNNRRLLEPLRYLPPAKLEEMYYRSREAPTLVAGLM